jgi:DNA polymerase III sliding clamp (beta) subunit (PCNA family)
MKKSIVIRDFERLVADLSKANRVVAKQTTIPILTGFHLQFTGQNRNYSNEISIAKLCFIDNMKLKKLDAPFTNEKTEL